VADALETVTEAIARIDAANPGWASYVAGGKWFARRTGELTKHERATRPQPPLEAEGPDELLELIEVAKEEGASWG